MRELPPKIVAVTLLLFVDVLLLATYLKKPYIILGAVLFVDGGPALATLGVLLVASLFLMFLTLRRHAGVRRYIIALAAFLIVNSASALIAAPFIARDLSGFLERILGGPMLAGYLTLQALFLLNNCLLLVAVRGLGLHLRMGPSERYLYK